jgi:hypothetical protein
MRKRPTRIEELDTKHPGLRQYVDLRLDANAVDSEVTLERICAEIKERWGETVALHLLSGYKQCRWWPAKQRIQDQIDRMQAIMAVVKEFGVGNYAEAYIVERLSESDKAVPPAVLLREQREREQLALDRQKLRLDVQKAENAKQVLELKLEELKAKRDRVRELVKETGDEGKNAAQALTRIREIYGIGA